MSGLAGRTVVLTGASSGIGAATADRLHDAGARLVLVGRDAGALDAVAGSLGAQSYVADFARLDAVAGLADRLATEHPAVDVLVHNAGTLGPRCVITGDGHELTLQVNALAPLLLTRRLAPRLQGGRVVFLTSSTGLDLDGLDLDDLCPGARYEPWDVYARSKLVVSLLSRELARRHPDTTFADVHPGVVTTGLIRDMRWQRLLAASPVAWFARRFLSTVDEAADVLVHAIESEEPGFFDPGGRADPGWTAQDPTLGARVWGRCVEMLG